MTSVFTSSNLGEAWLCICWVVLRAWISFCLHAKSREVLWLQIPGCNLTPGTGKHEQDVGAKFGYESEVCASVHDWFC